MVIGPFSFARLPRIEFGEGALDKVPDLARSLGRKALLVTGRRSFRESPRWAPLLGGMRERGIAWETVAVEGEPSPRLVDEAVAGARSAEVDVVLGIGGGSALDAAKATAGLIPHGNSVMDHLEGVGRGIPYAGPAVPFIAVPTTAGTGTEATKNAVLGERGPGGFKKSFRHECLVPEYAVVDPTVLETCPRELVAADGMDAVTQLIESFVSARANPATDALAWSGLEAAVDGLWEWYDGGDVEDGRRKMAYAALVSGITLAQTGLGAVHGMAAPLGAFFPAPHGAVCGTLLAAATEANVRAMEDRDTDNPALNKYARIGSLLSGTEPRAGGDARAALVEVLTEWTRRLVLPGLGAYGMKETDVDGVVAESRGSSMGTNPIVLTDVELGSILRRRL